MTFPVRQWAPRRRVDPARVPLYPAAFAAAFVLSVFTDSAAIVTSLPRPLILVLIVVIAFQLIVSFVTRSPDQAAFAMLLGLLVVADFAWLSVAAVVGAAIAVLGRRLRTGALSSLPWAAITRTLNAITLIALTLSIGSAAVAGALTPPASDQTRIGDSRGDLPDVYLILLDGYPRQDTLASSFDLDIRPFLDEMGDLGFWVAERAHSNYNGTPLTIASLFQMRQVPRVPLLATAGADWQADSRLLTRAINAAPGLAALHGAGYEIDFIPSAWTKTAVVTADRYLDSGQATELEVDLLRTSLLREFQPDQQRKWLMSNRRDRIRTTFDVLGHLAQQPGRPRFVFAHVLAPHPPIVFSETGLAVDGWPCFPETCAMWDSGEQYGLDRIRSAARGQVRYLNRLVAETARRIVAADPEAVIVVFSDHGFRHDPNDRAEMFRSLLLARTPGREGLFPADASPVNLLPRLLNAYAGTSIPLSTEEAYWLDPRRIEEDGLLRLEPFRLDQSTVARAESRWPRSP